MMPNDPVIGGVALRRPAMQSPNFVSGVTGWSVFQNGDAEFNNGVFRGTVTASAIVGGTITGALIIGGTVQAAFITGGTVSAALFTGGTVSASIINGGTINAALYNGTNFNMGSMGLLFYNGTPALGNLIASLAPASGTDTFGNAFLQGVTSYPTIPAAGFTGTYSVSLGDLLGTSGQQRAGLIIQNETAPANIPPYFAGDIQNPSNGNVAVVNSGKGLAGDTANSITVESLNAGNSIALSAGAVQLANPAVLTASAVLGYVALPDVQVSTPTPSLGCGIYANANSAVAAVNTTGFGGVVDVTEADTGSFTVTQAVATQISKIWSVPANDASAGTVYRLTVAGNGTWGSTQQVLSFDIHAFGVGGVVTVPIGATELPASTSFDWRAVVEVIVSVAGTSGAIKAGMSVTLAQNSNNQLTNAGSTNSAGAFTKMSDTTTANTSAADNITLQASWASTTGAPVIRSHYSLFERLGA